MTTRSLDLDALRAFVTAQDLGGFNRAAMTLNRSQSAVSQQLRKLEEHTGQALVRRDGRSLALTPAGETLLAYGRRLLSLNDEALTALQGYALAGQVRFGVVGDLAESWLPDTLAQFRRAHPMAQLEVLVDRASALFDALDRGALDLVLAFGGDGRTDVTPWRRLPQKWLGPKNFKFNPDTIVELVALPAPCRFRQSAIEQLEAAGIPWRIAFTGRSVATLWAAIRAGLGITFRMTVDLPADISILSLAESLPTVDGLTINLHDGGRGGNALAVQLKEMFKETVLSGKYK